ncbi:MAG: DUF4315 family protein [Oscillospiraceae bacterium]|jgi:hypothetical protein|nr:DUF4315 family protein [Oscillospiraceae bacterium]
MNPKIIKKAEEIERAKARIAELQALLPALEREKTSMENTEIVRVVRSANVAPGELSAFLASIKNNRPFGRTQEDTDSEDN